MKTYSTTEIKSIVQTIRGLTILDTAELYRVVHRGLELGEIESIAIESALTGKLGFRAILTQAQVNRLVANARHDLHLESQRYIKRSHKTKRYLAREWLLKVLKEPMQVTELMKLAAKANHSWFIVKYAKLDLSITSAKPDMKKGWLWLPPLLASNSKDEEV